MGGLIFFLFGAVVGYKFCRCIDYDRIKYTSTYDKVLKDVRKSLKSAGEEMRETLSAIGTGFTVVGTAVAAGATGILAFTKATAEANNEQILLANSKPSLT